MQTTGDTVHLRLWHSGDEDELVPLANNRRVWRNLTNRFPHPYTREDAHQWIGTANQRSADERHFAIVSDDHIVGGAGSTRLEDLHTRTAEVGYWVGEPHWGRGIATHALVLVTELAFRDFDFVRLQASVLEWNRASCRVLEKASYEFEAQLRRHGFKDGQVCDIWMYSLLRR